MDENELIEEVANKLVLYVMQGGLRGDELAVSLAPSSIKDDVEKFDDLLKLHFLLQDEVSDFVERLPHWLRSIKTQTESQYQTTRGTIEGKIDWGRTIRERYSQNPDDSALFVCDTRHRNYDLHENLVLKQLVIHLDAALETWEKPFEEEYDWIEQGWGESAVLKNRFQQTIERNLHFQRIRNPNPDEPTDRMVENALQSRHPVYQSAGTLYRQWEHLYKGDESSIVDLLENTLIIPGDRDIDEEGRRNSQLLELYVLFQIIDTLISIDEFNLSLQPVEKGTNEIARLEGQKTILLYHNSAATDHGFSFAGQSSGVSESDLTRFERIQETKSDIAKKYLNQSADIRTDRPDVFGFVVTPSGQISHPLVIEVKNSVKRETVKEGIEEILGYLAYLRHDGDLLFDESNKFGCFGSGSNGLLVTQDFAVPSPSFSTEPIQVLQATELASQLELVTREAFGL